MSDITPGSDDQLGRVLDFTGEELALNRTGQLSLNQLHRVEAAQAPALADLGCGLLLIGAVFGGGAILCGVLFDLQVVLESQIQWLLLLVPVLLIAGFAIWRANRAGAKERLERGTYDVTSLDGALVLHVTGSDGQQQGYLAIHDIKFPLEWDAFTALQTHLQSRPANAQYRVYFDADTHVLLSVEALRS